MRKSLLLVLALAAVPASAQQPDPRAIIPLLEQQRNAALNGHAVALALAYEEAAALKAALAERDRRIAELERRLAELEQRQAGAPDTAAPRPQQP